MLNPIIDRLRQPSTYAGLAVLLGLFGVNVAPEVWQSAVNFITAGAALAAVLLNERKD